MNSFSNKKKQAIANKGHNLRAELVSWFMSIFIEKLVATVNPANARIPCHLDNANFNDFPIMGRRATIGTGTLISFVTV